MSIEVHHLNNSRSQRILWLLEELGAAYVVVPYQRDPRTMLAPPELRAIHPLGKAPVIRDGTVVLAESGAIVEYLLDRFDGHGLRPQPGTPEQLRYRNWMHFAEGTAMPPLVMKLILTRLGDAAAPMLPRIEAQIATILDHLEAEVTPGGYFAGAGFTAADIQMAFPLEAAAARGGLGRERPRLWDLLTRLQARPAYRRAIERGGPYALLR